MASENAIENTTENAPLSLWQLVKSAFYDNDHQPKKKEINKQVSAGQPPTTVWAMEVAGDRFTVLARTKSEARAELKKMGLYIPKGVKIKREGAN